MAPDGLPMASGPQIAVAEPPRKRRRPALACEECRKRKIKCDRNNPCVHCKASKALVCSYRNNFSAIPPDPHGNIPVTAAGHVIPGQDRFVAAGVTSASPINPALSHVLPTPGSSPGTAVHGEIPRQRTHSASTLSVPSGSASDHTIQNLQSRIQSLEQQLSEARKTAPEQPGNESSPQRADKPLRGTLSKTRLFGPSHWMMAVASAEQFRDLPDFVRSNDLNNTSSFKLANSRATSSIWKTLEKCKVLARRLKSQDHTPWLTEAQWKESMPPREVADKLIGNYLRTFESTYRILHVPTFEAEYAQYWENPATTGTGVVIKLLLVMAIGTSFYQEGDSALHKIALQWIYAAQTWLAGPFEKRRLNLTGLQIFCLLILARQTAGVDEALLFVSVGTLVRFAMMMGLHRDPRYFPKMSIMQTEMRRRLWSTVLEMALQSSLDAGMIPMISLDDFDTQAPSNIDDRDMDENTTSLPTKPLSVFTQTTLQIILRQSFSTRLQILKLINHIHDEPSYDAILTHHRVLETAFRDAALLIQGYKASRPIPQANNNTTAPTTVTITTFHINLLTHLHRRLILSLHRPFVARSRTDPRYYFSRKTCLDTALRLLYPEPCADWSSLLLVAGGGFRETVHSYSGVTIYLELVYQIEDDVANLNSDLAANHAVREPLRQALREVKETYREQIKRGRTNVKAFCFMSIAMAHADAVERGVKPERAILEMARDTGREAFELLKTRLGDDAGLSADQDVEKEKDRDGERPRCALADNLMERLDRTAKEIDRTAAAGAAMEGAAPSTIVGIDGEGGRKGQGVDGLESWDDLTTATGGTDLDIGFDFSASWLFSGWDEQSWI